ncbi:hypothetical protein ABIB62_004653 [Mucilaginibacter sp. UYP25]|uniref:hypothetical protein n=1 Tax=unclassified Mucilaginibacter TaxID=2617802 RepID=UPI0033960C5A
MSDWNNKRNKEFTLFKHIKFLFESDVIKRMYEIREYHSGKISEALGMNKGRYALKLLNPETFSVFEILRFAYLIEVDPNLIINVIQNEKEVQIKMNERLKKDALKSNLKL